MSKTRAQHLHLLSSSSAEYSHDQPHWNMHGERRNRNSRCSLGPEDEARHGTWEELQDAGTGSGWGGTPTHMVKKGKETTLFTFRNTIFHSFFENFLLCILIIHPPTPYFPTSANFVSFFISLTTYPVQFVLPISSQVWGHPPECGRSTRDHSVKTNWLSLP